MKKILSLVLLAAMILAVLAGCAAPAAEPEKTEEAAPAPEAETETASEPEAEEDLSSTYKVDAVIPQKTVKVELTEQGKVNYKNWMMSKGIGYTALAVLIGIVLKEGVQRCLQRLGDGAEGVDGGIHLAAFDLAEHGRRDPRLSCHFPHRKAPFQTDILYF